MSQILASVVDFLSWSFTSCLWLLWWVFIIVAVITFIGFINVEFFSDNNAELSRILRDEQNQSISSSSDRGSDDERDLDGFESMNNSTFSGRSRREKRRAQSLKRRQERADRLWKPKWTLSRRMGSKRSASPKDDEVSHRPSLSNSPSLSPPSDSSQRSQDSITPSASTVRHHRINSNQSTISTMSTLSSNKSNSSSFTNPSDSCLTQKGREIKEEEDEEIISDLEGIHESKDNNIENDHEAKERKEDTVDSAVTALESGTIKCFDDVYDLMDRLKSNGTAMAESDKTRIQTCIESNALMKLKSFEKALLLQKVSEL